MLNKNSAKAVLTASEFRMPFIQGVLQDFVQQYLNRKGTIVQAFTDNRRGKYWCEYFLMRHPEISQRNSQNIKRCRAEVNAEVIQNYYEHLQQTIDTVPCENIINYYETNMTDDPGNERVLVRRGTKHASKIMDSSKSSTSVMFAALTDGSMLPPYIVFKSKYAYPDWILGGPEGVRYNRTISGWFDSDTFEDWFFQLALPHLRRKDGKKIIIGDNLGSHLPYKVLSACQENNIAFVFLPKKSTHICEPLDVAVRGFRPIKIAWRKVLTEWKMHHKGVVPKQTFPSLLKKMLDRIDESIKKNIISGFEATGIFPFNPEKVLNKMKPRQVPLMGQNDHIVE
ncbi:hypothetical protein NQ315_014353 [Exocentrus adspersus]|uniref:DDE-1 domain-containing protein n=1 Tax=Exocentrus adspersus TaxID=1586481 RepID=A0AAV8V9M5_9CUCU|nr:hypothetical protein NQ315_014353 [Exocentrus adspersus]